MQTPQSIQVSTSTTALSLTMLMASLGHSSTQASQPVHFCSSTLAGIYATLSKKLGFTPLEKKVVFLTGFTNPAARRAGKQKMECYKSTMTLQPIF
jgi:hypothetical protein